MGFAMSVLAVLAFAFVGVVGTPLIIIVVVFVIDRLQTGECHSGQLSCARPFPAFTFAGW